MYDAMTATAVSNVSRKFINSFLIKYSILKVINDVIGTEIMK